MDTSATDTTESAYSISPGLEQDDDEHVEGVSITKYLLSDCQPCSRQQDTSLISKVFLMLGAKNKTACCMLSML